MKKRLSTVLYEADSAYDLELYQYGVKIIKKYIQFICLFLLLSSIIGNTIESIVFCIAFSLLRSYFGGIHFDNENLCLAFSVLFTTFIPLIGSHSSHSLLQSFTILSITVFLASKPIDHKNKRLTLEEKVYFKKITLLLLFVEILISFFLTFINIDIAKSIYLAIISQALFILVDILKRRKSNEKRIN